MAFWTQTSSFSFEWEIPEIPCFSPFLIFPFGEMSLNMISLISVVALSYPAEEIDMPLDYLYTPNKQEWIQRKIQIGRRMEEFKVLLAVLEIILILSIFRENLLLKSSIF